MGLGRRCACPGRCSCSRCMQAGMDEIAWACPDRCMWVGAGSVTGIYSDGLDS